jgi:hypothetical protein
MNPKRVTIFLTISAVSFTILLLLQICNPAPVGLEDAPKMVRELGDLARRDVENDATNAGLKALSSHGSLAATLTGGLKRDLQNMNEGDDLLLARIESSVSPKSGTPKPSDATKTTSSKTASKEEKANSTAEKSATQTEGSKSKPAVSINAVQDAVKRDRATQMHELQLTLSRIKELKEKLALWHRKAKAEQAQVPALSQSQNTPAPVTPPTPPPAPPSRTHPVAAAAASRSAGGRERSRGRRR